MAYCFSSCTGVFVFTVPRAQARSMTPASLSSRPLPSRLSIPCTTTVRLPTALLLDALTLTSQVDSFWILPNTRREMIRMKSSGRPFSFFLETWAVLIRLTSFLCFLQLLKGCCKPGGRGMVFPYMGRVWSSKRARVLRAQRAAHLYKFFLGARSPQEKVSRLAPRGEGVLPKMGYIGICGPKG